MLALPDYWLPRPATDLNAGLAAAFDQVLAGVANSRASEEFPANGTPIPAIDYALPAPLWQFLCYVAEQRGLALHGSGNPDITLFEPRQPMDLTEFGNQKAVYAAGDGIWAMFFAIADRDRFSMSVTNACIRPARPGGPAAEPLYVFSVSQPALAHRPWRSGSVYLLPRASFVEQPPMPFGEFEIHIPQLASLVPVAPLARLAVSPADFPFLDRVRGHDHARLAELAAALSAGAPWPFDAG